MQIWQRTMIFFLNLIEMSKPISKKNTSKSHLLNFLPSMPSIENLIFDVSQVFETSGQFEYRDKTWFFMH